MASPVFLFVLVRDSHNHIMDHMFRREAMQDTSMGFLSFLVRRPHAISGVGLRMCIGWPLVVHDLIMSVVGSTYSIYSISQYLLFFLFTVTKFKSLFVLVFWLVDAFVRQLIGSVYGHLIVPSSQHPKY